jgi:glucokinase
MAARWHACVDIGGTKVAVSLADATADPSGPPLLHHRLSEPTVKSGPPEALSLQVLRLIDAACAGAGGTGAQVAAVGVSSCGPFVKPQGLIELAAPNICAGLGARSAGQPNDWTSLPMQAPLEDAFPLVRIENDCLAALRAERRWGALQGLDHCAYVTWSTGIGTGLCVDGHLLQGKNGNAGHAGHMFVSDDESALCGCGNVGDVEALVSGSAIARRFGLDAATLMAAARAGDTLALQQVDALCRVLGRALYNLVVTLDLQRISIGGSVFLRQQDLLLPRLRAQITGRLASLTDGFELVAAGLGDSVADCAAAALVV